MGHYDESGPQEDVCTECGTPASGMVGAGELARMRRELARLQAIEARVGECTNEHGTLGPITAHYVLTGEPFGKGGA